MKCQNCGAELAPGVAFCQECGTKVERKKRFCRDCGAELTDRARFCINCGSSVDIAGSKVKETLHTAKAEKNGLEGENLNFAKSNDGASRFSEADNQANKSDKNLWGNIDKQQQKILLIATAAIVVIIIATIVCAMSSFDSNNRPNDNNSNGGTLIANKAFDEIVPIVSPDVTIEPGTEYSYMSGEWNVYIAKAVSNSVIKVERWHKSGRSDKKMKFDSDLGSFRIGDEKNGFSWVDEEHTAFTLIIQDKNNSDVKKPTAVVFTINISDSDNDKGTDYDSKIAYYEYVNDDWHKYRAIALTTDLIKIECWCKVTSLFWESYRFGWDVGVINLKNTNTDFEWGDEKHKAFTITMIDPANDSHWKEKKLTSFILENEGYEYSTVLSFLGKTSETTDSTNSVKPQKNGFDSKINKKHLFGNFTIDIPTYWGYERAISDGNQWYAETGGKVVMIQVDCPAEMDPDYDVTFDGLMADNKNMIRVLEETLFKKITNYETIDTGAVKGILYSGTIETNGISGYGLWFIFPSENDRRWCEVVCAQSDSSDYLYEDDFMKMIYSIKKRAEETEPDINETKPAESTEANKQLAIILPDPDTKLGKDFDTKSSDTVYYINVDGTKNQPKLKKWGAATVTDGVAEYLDYLKGQGCTVAITNYEKKSPYSGLTIYEVYFEVNSTTIIWNMYLCIQDEEYIEYELDINLT